VYVLLWLTTSCRHCVYSQAMSLSHTFLAILDRGPQHGYALKQEFDDWFGLGRPLKSGQVYATLARLDREHLAEVVTVEAGAGPERKRYAITPEGVTELEAWLSATPMSVDIGLGSMYARVVAALLSGRSPGDVLRAQRAVHLEQMRNLRRKTPAGIEQALAADYSIAHLQADLDWIELAGARIESWRP